MKPLDFSNKILSWYGAKKRDLPWRNTCNPYKIWISEVILQQTRIDQGIGYYYRFIEKFPTISALANAEEEEIMKIWQGLGYYSRARNLHKGAKMIVSDLGGVFPNSSEKMKSIKGIGDYTSAAIASIVFNEPIAAVDGNVYRVLSRIFGIETPIDTTSGEKIFSELANQLIATDKPGDFNQAVMELGALVCKPRNPNCEECVFNTKCAALATNTIDKLPVKSKKTKVTDRFFNYLLIVQGDFIYMNKRGENDIWRNLYDLPCIETENKTTITELMKTSAWANLFKGREIDVSTLAQQKKQLLSHQKINAQFVTITLPLNENFSSAFIRINKNDIFDFPVPVLIDKFFQEYIR